MERNPNEVVSQNTAKAVTRSVEMARNHIKSSKCDSSQKAFPTGKHHHNKIMNK